MSITDKTITAGKVWKISWYLEWGRVGVWQKDRWAFEFHYPYVRWKHWQRELFATADNALRVNWIEKAIALQVLGFGVAFTLTPNRYKQYRNRGVCYHRVPLHRICPDCQEEIDDAE